MFPYASARVIAEHYLLSEPDVRQAIRDEEWLAGQDYGWLMEFENSVTILQTVLRRVMDKKIGVPA